MKESDYKTDFLIVGSGLAGLFAAYTASKYGKVLVVTKAELDDSNSWLAQGGIAVALEEKSTDSHFNDTLTAGRNLCDKKAVRVLVNEGVERVQELINLSMPFDKENGKNVFGLEGGHSTRRIIHSHGSSTGQEIIKFISNLIKNNTNINILYETHSLKIIKQNNRAAGIIAYSEIDNEIITINSKVTILATGGYSRIYSRNTNPKAAIGEGIWMAKNAGAEIRDMEFIQFHPTAFYSDTGETFLISEAVRGEGAFLLDENKNRFMPKYSPLNELAPRDLVAKAIFNEIQKSSLDYVFLDLRHLDTEKIKNEFTNIYNFAKRMNCDITKDLVPVAPAAHYSVGGIKTGLNGKTNIAGLFAAGEAASTGVHGANRLASNSLLECLVFSKRAALKAAENFENSPLIAIGTSDEYFINESTAKFFEETWRSISTLFSLKLGILRNEKNMLEAESELNNIQSKIDRETKDISLIRLNGVVEVGLAIIQSALSRKESRGCHQRTDYPEISDVYLGNFVIENSKIKFEKLKNE